MQRLRPGKALGFAEPLKQQVLIHTPSIEVSRLFRACENLGKDFFSQELWLFRAHTG